MKKTIKKVTMKKAQAGSSLGMKSVKAGIDKNPGVTRADIITAGRQNAGKAKNGVSYASAGKSTGHTGEGMLSPTPKNVKRTRKQATFKSGGSIKAQSGVVVSKKAEKTHPEDFKFLKGTKQNKPGTKAGKLMKKGGMVGKCKGGC